MRLEGYEIEGHAHPFKEKVEDFRKILECAVSRQPKVLIWNFFLFGLWFSICLAYVGLKYEEFSFNFVFLVDIIF